MPNIFRAKCAIVGDSKVGKTALTQMFISSGKTYPKDYKMTIGVDLTVKTVKIPNKDVAVEMLLYDSSGRDLYSVYLPKYWHGPNIILVVFDVTAQSSLDSVEKWVKVAKDAIAEEFVSTTPFVLFGNKTDLTERRVVSPKTGAAVANKLGMQYFEGSAKENQGTQEPFYLLVHEWHKLCETGQGDII